MLRLVRAAIALRLAFRAERARERGDYARAECLLREALARGVGTGITLLEVKLSNDLGVVLKYRGKFREATACYLGALRAVRRGEATPDRLARLYHNLGGLEHERGRHARGALFAARALQIRERTLGPDHPETAREVAALAALLDGLGRHTEAEALHRRAVRIHAAGRTRADRREKAFALANLAACRHLAGASSEGAMLAECALATQIRLLGSSHPEVRRTRDNLARMRRSNRAGS
ncbi:MAG: tetratricopeptide repeat protein [bacterium]